MKPTPPNPFEADWNQRNEIYNRIHNLFSIYVNLDCLLVTGDNLSKWTRMFYNKLTRLPQHFDEHFGRLGERDKYNNYHFDRARRERRSIVGEHKGFHDIFTPVFSVVMCHVFFSTSPFLKSLFSG